jgi:hypothetical protein
MMQEPARYDMTIYQGADFERVLTWSLGEPAALVDLSGYSARMQLRTYTASPEVVAELTTSNGRISLGGTAGTIALNLTAAQTETLTPNQYAYDLEVIAPDGFVTRLVEGFVNVDPEVTR